MGTTTGFGNDSGEVGDGDGTELRFDADIEGLEEMETKKRMRGDDLVVDAKVWSSEGGDRVPCEVGARWRLDLVALMAEEYVVAWRVFGESPRKIWVRWWDSGNSGKATKLRRGSGEVGRAREQLAEAAEAQWRWRDLKEEESGKF